MFRAVPTAVLLAMSLAAPAARAIPVTLDTIAVIETSGFGPLGVVDPVTGELHVAYVEDSTAWHAHKVAGVWQREAFADRVVDLDWAVGKNGRLAAAIRRSGDVLSVARPTTTGWVEEVVRAGPDARIAYALAVDAATDQPSVAWSGVTAWSRPYPTSLQLATRADEGWSITTIDTTRGYPLQPAIAAHRGVVWISWIHDGPDERRSGPLMVDRVPGDGGPRMLASPVGEAPVMSVDPGAEVPVAAYFDPRTSQVVSARPSHDGSWTQMPRWSVWRGFGLSLAVSGTGLERVANTLFSPFAREPNVGSEVSSCIYAETGTVFVHGAEGTGDSLERLYLPNPQFDARSSRRSLSVSSGKAHVVYPSPTPNCAPALLLHAEFPIETWEGPAPVPTPRSNGISRLAPNPGGGNRALNFRLELLDPAGVTMALHDLTGRRVAQRDHGPLPPGLHGMTWSPRALEPGLYWLIVRADGRTIGRKPWVVLR